MRPFAAGPGSAPCPARRSGGPSLRFQREGRVAFASGGFAAAALGRVIAELGRPPLPRGAALRSGALFHVKHRVFRVCD